MIPIFLSRPNPFKEEQELFLKKLINILNENNLNNITLVAQDYNPHESLTCLNEMIKRCYGMLIVSFGQSYIGSGIFKKSATDNKNFFDSIEREVSDIWVTSPFCHIEGALGFSQGLPLLVLKQSNVKIEGILKKDSHIISGPDFSLDSIKEIDMYFQSTEFADTLRTWNEQVNVLYNFVNNKIH